MATKKKPVFNPYKQCPNTQSKNTNCTERIDSFGKLISQRPLADSVGLNKII